MVKSKNYFLYRFTFKFLALLISVLAFYSCNKTPIRETIVNPPGTDTTPVITTFTDGIFVINEGNFKWGNASITFIDRKTNGVEQDLFNHVNKRSLGDVAESMKIQNGLGFIVVNNSNKVEVVSLTDFKSSYSITTGFSSPRNIEFIDSSKAYVTNMLGGISVVDLTSKIVTGFIPGQGWMESMVRYNDYIFATCVGTYNEPNSKRKPQVDIISTKEDKVVDSISIGKEPMAIVEDRKQKLWVLCTGGFDGYEAPTLVRIDPELRITEKVFSFTKGVDSPSRLCINPTGDTLYFLNNGIFSMPVNAAVLPATPLIPAQGHIFYGLGVNPLNGNLYVTDAVDYVQDGRVYQYNQNSGSLIKSYSAGRIPGSFCFTGTSRKVKKP